jgi:multiple sugar transport system substrate-binding protein
MKEIENSRLSRRQMLKIMGAVTGASALAACGGQAPTPAQPAPEQPAAEPATEQPAEVAPTAAPAAEGVTIRWYANADPTRNAWMTDVAMPKFKEIHPEYTIEPIIVPWDEFDPKLTAMFAAKDLPEVFANWGSTGYVEYKYRGMCIYMDEYIASAADELKLDDIPQSALDGVKVNGKLVGLPLYILGTYTFYNKDLFDKAGIEVPPSDWDDKSWTWDKMLEVAGKLTSNYEDPATGQYGVVMGLGSPEEMPWLNGHSIWSDETLATGIAKEIFFDDPKAVEAYQMQYDLVCKHKVAPDAAISSAISATGDPFQAGKVAMNVGGGWGFWSLKEVAGSFNWNCASLPRIQPDILADALYADPMLISAQTDKKDQAWEFVKFLYMPDGMKDFMLATWSPPSRKELLQDWVNLWPDAMRPDLVKSLEGSWKYGIVTPWNRIAGYSQIYDPIYSALDPAALCEATVAEVAPGIQEEVNGILAGLQFEES